VDAVKKEEAKEQHSKTESVPRLDKILVSCPCGWSGNLEDLKQNKWNCPDCRWDKWER
jgi:hypothetical protein